jgi:hypothetical protein
MPPRDPVPVEDHLEWAMAGHVLGNGGRFSGLLPPRSLAFDRSTNRPNGTLDGHTHLRTVGLFADLARGAKRHENFDPGRVELLATAPGVEVYGHGLDPVTERADCRDDAGLDRRSQLGPEIEPVSVDVDAHGVASSVGRPRPKRFPIRHIAETV